MYLLDENNALGADCVILAYISLIEKLDNRAYKIYFFI